VHSCQSMAQTQRPNDKVARRSRGMTFSLRSTRQTKARDASAKEAETFATKSIAEVQQDLKDLIAKLG
jgi:hypothetical protein